MSFHSNSISTIDNKYSNVSKYIHSIIVVHRTNQTFHARYILNKSQQWISQSKRVL